MSLILRCVLPVKKKWAKNMSGRIFDKKNNFEKFKISSGQKTRIKQFSKPPLSL